MKKLIHKDNSGINLLFQGGSKKKKKDEKVIKVNAFKK